MGLELLETAPLDELVAELAKAPPGLIVVEPRPGDPPEVDKGQARRVADAALKTEADRLADRQGRKVRIRKSGSRGELVEHLGCRERGGIGHQRQIDEFLDRPLAKCG